MAAADPSSSSSSSDGDYEDAQDNQTPAQEPPSGSSPAGYRLLVSAGPSYDAATHHPVLVNSSERQTIESDTMTLEYAIRIKHFTGLPTGSPESSPYFEHPLHKWDQYSISLAFVPKEDIPGNALVFGNDFDRPIRDRLPPGFNQAFKFVKWWVDPGLEGDVYADKPYLYGPALSSWNTLRIGDKVVDEDRHDIKAAFKVPDPERFHETVVEEGADGSGGEDARAESGMPADAAGRKKYYLTPANRDNFTFEKGRLYMADFFNPYLDFNDFSLKLPGFSLNVINYVDAKTHELRYVLKNRETDELYVAFMFTLLWGEEREREEKAELEGGKVAAGGGARKEASDSRKNEDDDIPDDDDDID